ncbi:MAG: hypothetical protein AB8B74_06250 [Crocinitomicaceae bacterium]
MRFLTIFLLVLAVSCNKKKAKSSLSYYIDENKALEQADLIGCAASQSPLSSNTTYPTDVFFYPINGAYNYRYFECEDLADSSDFSKYFEKELPQQPVFGGYLHKFKNTNFDGERMGVVTYETPGKLHTCTPIRLKNNVKPTEYNSVILTTTENGITPTFEWQDGKIKENVIYFQVVSDTLGNFISGTYTYDTDFTFYDTSNVVLNITKGLPELLPNSRYNFTLMAVSEDNWVNLISQKTFNTF